MTAGTCNGGDRGNTRDRRARREWLVETFPADRWLRRDGLGQADTVLPGSPCGVPSTRCFRCGKLLTVETVTPDRIKPGVEGGTYRRNNLRPACSRCQSITGNEIKAARRKPKKRDQIVQRKRTNDQNGRPTP